MQVKYLYFPEPTKEPKESGYELYKRFYSDLTVEFLREQYFDYSFEAQFKRTSEPLQFDNYAKLAESVTVTVPIEQVKRKLYSLYLCSPKLIRSVNPSGNVECIDIVPNIGQNESIILGTMSALGWRKAYTKPFIEDGMEWTFMSFDPIFQKDISSTLLESTLFHLTPNCNINSIKSKGLVPKSENTFLSYPERIHFILSTTSDDEIYNLCNHLYNKSDNLKNNGIYTIIGFKYDDLSDNIQIYYDPRYSLGYYTTDVIPSNILYNYGSVNLKAKIVSRLNPKIPL